MLTLLAWQNVSQAAKADPSPLSAAARLESPPCCRQQPFLFHAMLVAVSLVHLADPKHTCMLKQDQITLIYECFWFGWKCATRDMLTLRIGMR